MVHILEDEYRRNGNGRLADAIVALLGNDNYEAVLAIDLDQFQVGGKLPNELLVDADVILMHEKMVSNDMRNIGMHGVNEFFSLLRDLV